MIPPIAAVQQAHGLESHALAHHPDMIAMSGSNDTFPACPYTWAKQLHPLNCEVVWPKEYTGDHKTPMIELDTDKYVGRLRREKTMEKLLAMAGLRLAKVVNEGAGGARHGRAVLRILTRLIIWL